LSSVVTITLRPEPGVDEIRSLWALLKTALRSFKLRCTRITPTEVEMAAAIEVLEIKPLPDAGSLKALAKVRLGCVVLHGCRVIQQSGQKARVALP
jgi:hypothetical protein